MKAESGNQEIDSASVNVSTFIPPTSSLRLSDSVAMRKTPIPVIPSAARDLVFSATYEDEIPRLRLGMTIAPQSLCGVS